MKDEIIEQLWKAKDEIAEECGHDLRKLAALLRERQRIRGHKPVNHTKRRSARAREKA